MSTEQDEKNQATLRALLDAGADLSQPTELSFYVYAESKSLADLFAEGERADGWDCEVRPPLDGYTEWLVLLKTHAVPSFERISGFTERFLRREALFGVQFDGWEALVTK